MSSLWLGYFATCAGNVPHDVAPHLCGASLLACSKKGGGLRPIAVGKVLTSKCTSQAIPSKAVEMVMHFSWVLGFQCAMKYCPCSGLFAARSCAKPEDKWSLFLGFYNAFSSISPDKMIEEIRTQILYVAVWIECCYGTQVSLVTRIVILVVVLSKEIRLACSVLLLLLIQLWKKLRGKSLILS